MCIYRAYTRRCLLARRGELLGVWCFTVAAGAVAGAGADGVAERRSANSEVDVAARSA
jgi:hypothetical protein